MSYPEAVKLLFEKMGTHKIMALGASANDVVTVRNLSCVLKEEKIFFKTDKHFRKTQMLLENPNVALCCGGVQIEGVAKNLGLVAEAQNRWFEALYNQYWLNSYNAYPHEESEILVEVTPRFVEIWDQRADGRGFQTNIDFGKGTATVEDYD